MSTEAFRFRVEGALVVLQVLESSESNPYFSECNRTWRDAKVTDLLDVASLISLKRTPWRNDIDQRPFDKQ